MPRLMTGRSVLAFGRGPVRDDLVRRLLAADCHVLRPRTNARPTGIDGALISLERLAAQPSRVALEVFDVVEALELSRRTAGTLAPRVVILCPMSSEDRASRLGMSLARTLSLYLGAPTRTQLDVVEAPAAGDREAVHQAAALSFALLSNCLPTAHGRLFCVGHRVTAASEPTTLP